MNCRVVFGCSALIAAGAVVIAAQLAAQPAAQQRPEVVTATAIVSGRVLSPDGTPVRSAEVRIRAENGRDTRLATTDMQGNYEVRDLTPGAWIISASKAGFVEAHYGQRYPDDRATPTEVRDGQRLTASITLLRGGVVAGQVFDANGEPVLGATVRVLRSRMVRGQRQLASVGMEDRTDDTGAFRIHGLMPGSYFVSASIPVHESSPQSSRPDLVVFYPGSPSVSDAQPVTVVAAQEQVGLILVAPPTQRGVRVSGTVADAQGAAVAGAMVHLYDAEDPAGADGARGIAATSDDGGRFDVLSVAPGSYTLEVMTTQGGPARFEYAAVPVGIGGTDVTNLTLTTQRAVALRATIVTSPAGTSLPPRFTMQIAAEGTHRRMQTEHVVMRLDGPDGTALRQPPPIEVQGLHGRMHLRVGGLPDGWALVSIEVDGKDVTTAPVDFTGVSSTAVARIVVTNRTASIAGRVVAGESAPWTHVIVFPEDPTRWSYPAPHVKTAPVTEDGRFVVQGLIPGERYRAVAVSYLEQDEHQDPELLERLKTAGESFEAVAGGTEGLRLTLVTR